MSRLRLSAVLPLVLLLAVPASGAERLTDEQIKKLIADIDDGFDTWKSDLEKQNLDDAVITSSERTINVKTFLKDFERAIDTLKDRFKPEFAATPEALALLRLGSDVERRASRQSGDKLTSSSWAALGTKLGTLAGAYDVGWPIQSMNVKPVRLNDEELAVKVVAMEKAAKQLKSETDKAAKANKTIDKASRQALTASTQRLVPLAKEVRVRIQDDRPAAVEVGQLFAHTAKVKEELAKLALFSPGAAWQGIETANEALARAYALPKP